MREHLMAEVLDVSVRAASAPAPGAARRSASGRNPAVASAPSDARAACARAREAASAGRRCEGEPARRRSRRAREQVHRRVADEARDEDVRRLLVELARRGDLLDAAAVEHGDAMAERHRLDLVVRDVEHRRAGPSLEIRDLGADLAAKLGVEVRERLVEQEDRGLADERAAHRDPLALAAGELLRQPVELLRRGPAAPPPTATRLLDLGAARAAACASGNSRLPRTVMCG